MIRVVGANPALDRVVAWPPLRLGASEAHLALLRAHLEGEAGRTVDQGCFVDADSYHAHISIHAGHFYQQWHSLPYDRIGVT